MNKSKYFKDLIPLVAICLVASLLLAVFNMITEGPIRENADKEARETRQRIMPAAASFEEQNVPEGLNTCFASKDEGGNVIGYIVTKTVSGYGGEIELTLGADLEGKITGLNVGGDNFSETAGLGAKSKDPEFTDQFMGKATPLTLIKAGGTSAEDTIDAISGATITSTAVVNGVNAMGEAISALMQ